MPTARKVPPTAREAPSMLVARYPTNGPDAGRLRLDEIDVPEPGPGEVLVEVRVSGVNPTDWKARDGSGVGASDVEWVIPHHDGAGVIAEVGAGVDAARVGERVWLWLAQWRRAHGTAAQYVALPAEQAIALPDDASFDLGAGLGIPALTAHRCLFARGALADAAVLVQGGAGAVGHAGIELARWGGARVAATVSGPEKAALARAAGADVVIDYCTEDVADRVRAWAPEGVQRVVEVNLSANLETDAAVLASGGVVSVYAAIERPVLPPLALMMANASIDFMLVYTMPEEAKRAAVADVSEALAQGALTAMPATRFALQDTAAAHDAVSDGAIGKVLIDLPPAVTAPAERS